MASFYGLRSLMVFIQLGQYLHRTVRTSPSYDNLTKIYTEVLTGYDTRIKPRKDLTEFVNVTIEFSIESITEFDVVDQVLGTAGTFTLKWSDDNIQWEPDNFEGIDEIDIPISQVWSPAIVVGMGFDSFTKLDNNEDFVMYHHSGKATWVSKGVYSAFCEVDAKYYPYDTQSCSVSISVTHSLARHVNIEAYSNSTSQNDFKINSRWVLVDVAFNSQSGSTSLVLNIKLQRLPQVAMSALIAPVLILQTINSVTLLVPVESGEKGSIAATLFLAYGVFVSTLAYQLPSSSKRISLLSIYVAFAFSFSAATMILSLFQTMVYFHKKVRTDSTNQEQKIRDLQKKLSRDDRIFFAISTGISLLGTFIIFIILDVGSEDYYQSQ